MMSKRSGTRTFFHSLTDAWQGVCEGAQGRTMRIMYGLVMLSALSALLRGVSPTGWILFVAFSGVFFAAEHFNNAVERSQDRFNRFIEAVKRGTATLAAWETENEDTRYIKDQAAAGVLILGIFLLGAGILVLIFKV